MPIIRTRNTKSRHFSWRGHAPASAVILWACLWCNLNTGFWEIKHPHSADEWQLMVRAILPFVVLPAACIFLLRQRKIYLTKSGPSSFLLWYGLCAAFSAIFSPKPLWSLYWSMNFVATILVAWTFLHRRNPVGFARQLLQITWVGAFIVAAIIAREASDVIFGHSATAYSAIVKATESASRSSGVARWAAVPGLVCLIRAYYSRSVILIATFLGLAGVAFFIVYRMQSRGAVFGCVAALLFALLISSRMRRYALPFAILAIVVVLLVDSPATLSQQVTSYIERGQTREEFLSMTGRTRAYTHGLAAFEDAPLFGYGQWADRLITREHVHNSYLSALMNSGIVGGIPYFASWITGWILFFKLHKRNARLSPKDRLCLVEAGTVMMFFTVRAIPETTTAEFGVDLLVMVAVYVYMEVLAVSMVRKSRRRLAPMQVDEYQYEDETPLQPVG